MKKLIFLTSLFLSLSYTFAQIAKQNIEKDFKNYSQLVSENEIDDALEYTNPQLFEIIPKESMKSLFEAVIKMPNIKYKISAPLINEISEVKRIENIDLHKMFTMDVEPESSYKGIQKINVIDWLLKE